MRSAKGSRPTRRSKAEATTGLAPKKASATQPSGGGQQYGRYQRVLISSSAFGFDFDFDFDFDMAYFFGGVSEERRPWIPETRRQPGCFCPAALLPFAASSPRLLRLGTRTLGRLPHLRRILQIEILVPVTCFARSCDRSLLSWFWLRHLGPRLTEADWQVALAET